MAWSWSYGMDTDTHGVEPISTLSYIGKDCCKIAYKIKTKLTFFRINRKNNL